MNDIETNRKLINKKQTSLRTALTSSSDREKAILMLLEQHASLHSSRISDKNIWSFEDAILDGISDYTFRQIPKNHEHSIAWCIWHIARIEDITMNMLVDCIDQVFKHDNWQDQLNIRFKHSGNEMKQNEIEDIKTPKTDHARLACLASSSSTSLYPFALNSSRQASTTLAS